MSGTCSCSMKNHIVSGTQQLLNEEEMMVMILAKDQNDNSGADDGYIGGDGRDGSY